MINISNLTSNKSGKSYIFSDLNLQFKEKQASNNSRNNDIVSGNDLVVDYDAEAIKNSIRNLLFQKRYLTNFNVNLLSYIGQPISEMRGISLGEEIEVALKKYENRIKVEKIYVGADTDRSVYYISMIVKILNLDITERLDAVFDKNGTFHFINNS